MPPVRFDPLLEFLDHDHVGGRLFMNLDRDKHPVEHILFRPEARIQSVQTSDSTFEQGFRFDFGSVLDSKAVHIFDDAVPLEH